MGWSERFALYRDLVEVTLRRCRYVPKAQWRLGESVVGGMGYEVWRVQVEHYKPLIERVIEQTERRVFAGETVPGAREASECV